MVDEFLLEKIREKMKEKGATVSAVRQSFDKIYREKDIELAFQAYLEEEEKQVTAQALQVQQDLSRRKEKSFSWQLMWFIFHQPYLWVALMVFTFIRLYEWRASLVVLSSPVKQAAFLVFFIFLFVTIVLFLARAIGWVAEFQEAYGKPGQTILRGVQVELINFVIIIGVWRVALSNPLLVLLIFIAVAVIFEAVIISLAYRLDFKGALSTFLFFQLLFFVLWFCAHAILNLVFPPVSAPAIWKDALL